VDNLIIKRNFIASNKSTLQKKFEFRRKIFLFVAVKKKFLFYCAGEKKFYKWTHTNTSEQSAIQDDSESEHIVSEICGQL